MANDFLYGDAQANRLDGGVGNDLLSAIRAARDRLVGGGGDDVLTGLGEPYDGSALIEQHIVDFVAGGFEDRMLSRPRALFGDTFDFDQVMAAGEMVGDDAVVPVRRELDG